MAGSSADADIEVRWTTVGAPALDVLAELVADVQRDDPLRPVSVVTPTPTAAVLIRRELARRNGGLVAVSFHSLDGLAEQLAAPVLGDDRVFAADREVIVAAVRRVLNDTPGRFRSIADHRATWEALARTIVELAALTDDQRRAMATAGGLATEVVRVHDLVAARVGIGGRARTLRVATDRVRRDPAACARLGPVVVHLPTTVDSLGGSFLRSLAARGRVTIVAGLTGHDRVDERTVRSVVELGGAPPTERDHVEPATPTGIVSTNDVDDEVRAAVRTILTEVENGHGLHTMALVHPSGAPYATVVAEVLRSAGVPYSGPSTETLGHTLAGRALLGLLEVAATDFGREAVVDLWSSGVVVDGDGAPIPAVALDHRSRRLGVAAGRVDWSARTDARRRWLDAHPVETVVDDTERSARRLGRRQQELDELAAIDVAIDTFADLLDRLPRDWTAIGSWAGEVLDALCGSIAHRTRWPDHEIDADAEVRTALGRLGALAEIEPDPSARVVRETIRAVLDGPAPRRSTAGSGLLVTTLQHPPVVPLHGVVVVGLAEGHVPRLARDDVLLPDVVRRGAGLSLTEDETLDQQWALAAALRSATGVRLLTYARCDQRSGRTQVPSRWLIDAVESVSGVRPRTEHLLHGADVPGVDVVHSHVDAMRRVDQLVDAALHLDERRVASLSRAASFDAHPAVLDPVICSGAAAVRGRAADAFTRFDGNLVGEGIDVLADDNRHLSPTGIETYATCPRKWFFRNALGIGEIDRPEEVERLQPRDKGTLAHRILERFVAEAIDAGSVPEPHASWGLEGRARLVEIAHEEFDDFERRGLTGHPTWWAYDRDEILDVLASTLDHDDEYRARHDATPVAVELTFGREGAAPLRVMLDDGREVPLAGQADRVDEVPGGVRVYDYKYASSRPYLSLRRSLDEGGDPLDHGRRLQLSAYAEAAAAQRGIDRASAWYWFLRPGHTGTLIGYEITPAHRDLFRKTLGVIVDGVARGLFPARSGPDDWWLGTNTNCGFCEFDPICPADREDEWERVRADASLHDVVQLVEDGAPSFLVTVLPEEDPR